LTLSYAPSGDVLALHLSAGDAGAALAALGLTRGVARCVEVGWRHGCRQGTLADHRHIGHDRFSLTDAPVAARLVNAVSPTGFIDLVSGQGLGFDRLNARWICRR